MLGMQEMTFPGFMRGILATHVAFSHCYPPLIYYLTERSLFKKCPPTGKSLKKVLIIAACPDRSSFLLSTIVQQMVAIWEIWMTPMPSYTVPVFFLFTRHRTAPKSTTIIVSTQVNNEQTVNRNISIFKHLFAGRGFQY